MANQTQIDIRELSPKVWRLEFDYEPEFIEVLKKVVPHSDRSYDPATKFWTIRGNRFLPAVEQAAVKYFAIPTKIFRRGEAEVWRNLITGHESIQENLFQ